MKVPSDIRVVFVLCGLVLLSGCVSEKQTTTTTILIPGCNRDMSWEECYGTGADYVWILSIPEYLGPSKSHCNCSKRWVDEAFKCEKDEDCIKINKGCCSCSSSGSLMAINRMYQDAWNLQLVCPKVLMCPAGYNCDKWTEPLCINNTCILETRNQYNVRSTTSVFTTSTTTRMQGLRVIEKIVELAELNNNDNVGLKGILKTGTEINYPECSDRFFLVDETSYIQMTGDFTGIKVGETIQVLGKYEKGLQCSAHCTCDPKIIVKIIEK
ncbi:MAG: hypothetical protein ABH851_07205 [Methanobacteriota archaeon]